MQATFETRVKDLSVYPALDAIAELYGRAGRALFVDRYVHRRSLVQLKREYLRRFGLTARQFNAIAALLEGKVRATRETAKRRASTLYGGVAAAAAMIASLGKRVEARRLRFQLHQKRRRLRSSPPPSEKHSGACPGFASAAAASSRRSSACGRTATPPTGSG